MQFLLNTRFDFIGKRKIALISSGVLILLGLVSLVIHQGPNYGIDFLGGTSVELRFEKDVAIADVRNAVSNAGYGNAEIKSFGAANEILIRVQEQETGTEITDAIKAELTKSFPDNPYIVQLVEKVGPKIGSELRKAAIWA
ncbi:MAG: protein translocase subunit SecF, partial [bacterium]